MVILIFVYLASTFYIVRNGVGKERLFFLLPLVTYLAMGIISVISLSFSKDQHGPVFISLSLATTVATIATCIFAVGKIRKNSMARVLAAIEGGIIPEVQKKFEL